MKTAEQIEKWLKSQNWYKSFKRNCIKYNFQAAECVLKGYWGRYTIDTAFLWKNYPYKEEKGDIFWNKVRNEFIKWFDS